MSLTKNISVEYPILAAMSSYSDLCKSIIAIDKDVRFAGVADHLGKMLAYEVREGLQPMLTKEESAKSVMQSALRMGTRKTLEHKLGNTIYAFAMYEKVKRATIPVSGSRDKILMVSFEVQANHEKLILDRIIPLVGRHEKRS